MADFNDILIDPNERFIKVLENRAGSTFLSTGNIGRQAIALTNKRVYYKGHLYLAGKEVSKTVDLDDITGTSYLRFTPWYLLIIAIFFLFGSLSSFSRIDTSDDVTPLMISCGVLSTIFWFGFFVLRRNIFRIEFAGGNITVELRLIDKANMDDFHRKLKVAKDTYDRSKNNFSCYTDVFVPTSTTPPVTASVTPTTPKTPDYNMPNTSINTENKCPNCGTTMMPNAHFCTSCGKHVASDNPPATPTV